MKSLKRKISISIDGDTLEAIKKKAEDNERSLSQFISLILKEYLKKSETK